jgi:nicotinamide-nucleotide amidase
MSMEAKVFHEVMHLSLLKEVEVDPFLRTLKASYRIDPLPAALAIQLSSSDQGALKAAKKGVQEKFGRYLFAEKTITEALHAWMTAHHKTLAFAESCTGGFMAADMTALPGASKFFLGSTVVYANELKEKILNVSSAAIREKGAVSQEVVQEMLQNLFRVTEADYGIAVSGIAGPTGGTSEKPIGTICYALGSKERPPQVGTFHVKGSREVIILLTTRTLFGLLWILINNK